MGKLSRDMGTWMVGLALGIAGVGGCTPNDEPEENNTVTGNRPGDELRSGRSRVTSPMVTTDDRQALADGNRQFAMELFQQLRGQAPNVFFSPHSISEALAMTYAGARNATETQMSATLDFTLPQARLHPAFNELDLALASRGQNAQTMAGVPFTLRIVNAIWGQLGYPFEAPFLDTMAESYGAGLRVLDYAEDPEGSRQVINTWVSDQTNAKIPELIGQGLITPLTRMVLTNAIYFLAAWKEPFEARDTVDGPFALLDGTTRTVPLISGMRTIPHGTGDGWAAVQLPYDGNEIGMLVVLPDAGRFSEVEGSLDAAKLNQVVGSLASADVNVKLPKFTVEFGLGLKDTLRAMGMEDAFNPSAADFSGLTSAEQVYIAEVVHKAFVAVDEKGTEAAAATAVIVAGRGGPGETVDFHVMRPFVFFIRDLQTGAILFAGRVTQP